LLSEADSNNVGDSKVAGEISVLSVRPPVFDACGLKIPGTPLEGWKRDERQLDLKKGKATYSPLYLYFSLPNAPFREKKNGIQ